MRKEIDQTIELRIESMYPIIYILTWEEERLLRKIGEIAKNLRRTVVSWSCSQGIHEDFMEYEVGEDGRSTTRPDKALDYILSYKADDQDQEGGVIFVFKDFHRFMRDSQSEPLVVRKLRDVAAEFRRSSEPCKTLLLLSPVLAIPPELEKDITIIDYPLPDPGELEEIWKEVLGEYDYEPELKPEDQEDLLKAALGLTENESRNVLKKLIVSKGGGKKIERADVDFIAREKEQTIFKSGILEYYSSFEGFESLGGLEELKSWLKKRANSFTQHAREFGLPEPKGVLLLGVPGCGKSMCAKVVAAEWHKPLLRLDIGRIFGGLVGSSEENMRRAIKVAESVSPCILWLDEIEKGFAGVQGGGDSGVTARVFGTLLTWMQEKTKPVFVVATANDIRQLPPELLRKGRFDEIFFVDLPAEEEREEIFKIHIQKRKNPVNFLDKQWEGLKFKDFAKQAEGFSGAEIEQVIVSALYDAHYLLGVGEPNDPPDYNHLILNTMKQTVPLSQAMKATVSALRQWAETRARFASPKKAPSEKLGVEKTGQPQPRLRLSFTFQSGERARNLQQLVELCEKYPDEATAYLDDKSLENWLRNSHFSELAEKVAECRQSEHKDYVFQFFLEEARAQLAG